MEKNVIKKDYRIENNSKILFKLYELKGENLLNDKFKLKNYYELNLNKKFNNKINVINRILKNDNMNYIKDEKIKIKFINFLKDIKGSNKNNNFLLLKDIKIKELD